MGRKKLPDDDKFRAVVVKAKGRLWAEAEAVLLPGETLSQLARLAIEAEVARRQHDALLAEGRNVLRIYDALLKRSEDERARVLANRSEELAQMRDRVVQAVGVILSSSSGPAGKKAKEAEPSIDELFD